MPKLVEMKELTPVLHDNGEGRDVEDEELGISEDAVASNGCDDDEPEPLQDPKNLRLTDACHCCLRVGTNWLLCGKKRSRWPYHVMVGPDWPCMRVAPRPRTVATFGATWTRASVGAARTA